MNTKLFLILLSSVLVACGQDNELPQVTEEVLRNELELSFIGGQDQDKAFGYNQEMSSVECRYDGSSKSLRVVAYQFVNGDQLKVSESLQLTDVAIENFKSSVLRPAESELVPSFIFLSDQETLRFTENSNCSTYYEIEGDVIQGRVSCFALENQQNEKSFVSMRFQCRNQSYLMFQIKEEML
jgi:hypothetical protein